ncbi:hypothetical protein ACLVWU_08465 [Bdellovibrio sp. HCB290]|uniref:hypothetical protein n=1 Tax=Bdellovibrio sp. HCB290 TaxID=3394356 RepID=UPI0039B51944
MAKKLALYSGLFLVSIVLGIHFLLEASCTNAELQRITSPDNTIEAVLSTRECGATTGTAYFVSLVKPHSKPDKSDHVAVMDDVEKIKVLWLDSNTLSITYDQARFFDLKKSLKVGDKEVIIQETKNPN